MTGAPSDTYLGGLFHTSSAANIARKQHHRGRRIARPPRPPKQPKPRKERTAPKRNDVAELISQGLEFEQIAERIGITVKAAKRHFEKIRAQLGAQAV